MTPNEYQRKALNTCTKNSYSLEYLIPGLASEAGEVAGKFAKMIRKHGSYKKMSSEEREQFETELMKELGDVMWFIALTAHIIKFDLEIVMSQNIAKLTDRQSRGVIEGDGDNR